MPRLATFIALPLIWLMLLHSAQGAETARQQLDEFLTGLETLRAEFAQSLLDEKGQVVDESRGTLYLVRPDRFRWDYRDPYPQLIVADGKQVWMYEPDLEQATVRAQRDLVGSTPAALLSTTEPVEERFEVAELGAGDDGYRWLGLTPKDSSASFVAIRVGFNASVLKMMELEDTFGQTTRIVFSQLTRNPVIDGAKFLFEPPAGTDVIRGN